MPLFERPRHTECAYYFGNPTPAHTRARNKSREVAQLLVCEAACGVVTLQPTTNLLQSYPVCTVIREGTDMTIDDLKALEVQALAELSQATDETKLREWNTKYRR